MPQVMDDRGQPAPAPAPQAPLAYRMLGPGPEQPRPSQPLQPPPQPGLQPPPPPTPQPQPQVPQATVRASLPRVAAHPAPGESADWWTRLARGLGIATPSANFEDARREVAKREKGSK